jgi:hypothetical protein
MQEKEIIGLITRIGPITSGPKPRTGPTTTTPFHIEVGMLDNRSAVLSLTPVAATELAEQLGIYLQAHGSR